MCYGEGIISLLVANRKKPQKEKNESKKEPKTKKEKNLFFQDGRPINMNEPEFDFTLTDDENEFILDIHIWK